MRALEGKKVVLVKKALKPSTSKSTLCFNNVQSRQCPEGRGEGISGEKGEGFVGTIIKDTWTITGGGGEQNGREVSY